MNTVIDIRIFSIDFKLERKEHTMFSVTIINIPDFLQFFLLIYLFF